jgi:signal transduction histidine kinase
LRNVVKHGKTLEANVELSGQGDEISLCVSDPGAGFNPEGAQSRGGLGLVSMRERLRLIGGRFAVESEPLHGTRIRVRVPLNGDLGEDQAEPKQSKASA